MSEQDYSFELVRPGRGCGDRKPPSGDKKKK